MNERDFINWLTGFLDAYTSSTNYELTNAQVDIIKSQLGRIKFDKHEEGLYVKPDENTTTTLLG